MLNGEFVPTLESPYFCSICERSSMVNDVTSCWYVLLIPRIHVAAMLINSKQAVLVIVTVLQSFVCPPTDVVFLLDLLLKSLMYAHIRMNMARANKPVSAAKPRRDLSTKS